MEQLIIPSIISGSTVSMSIRIIGISRWIFLSDKTMQKYDIIWDAYANRYKNRSGTEDMQSGI